MFRRPATILFPFAQSRVFWKLKGFWDRAAFRYSRFMYFRRQNLQTKKQEFWIFLNALKIVSLYTALVILVLILVEMAERFVVGRGWHLGLIWPPNG